MDKLLLMLVAFSSGVLCNAEQNLTDTANSTLDPMRIMNNTENVYNASAELETMSQRTIRCNSPNSCCSGNFGKPTYKLHKDPRVWNEARKHCKSEGGELAVITSVKESLVLAVQLGKAEIPVMWMGAHDLFNTDDWVTLTGETLEAAGFDEWGPGEPNGWGGEKHCGAMTQWGVVTNRKCENPLPYFCKTYVC